MVEPASRATETATITLFTTKNVSKKGHEDYKSNNDDSVKDVNEGKNGHVDYKNDKKMWIPITVSSTLAIMKLMARESSMMREKNKKNDYSDRNNVKLDCHPDNVDKQDAYDDAHVDDAKNYKTFQETKGNFKRMQIEEMNPTVGFEGRLVE